MKEDKQTKLSIWPILISSLFSAISIAIYFFVFHKGFSLEQSDWGSFGSYLGGILGPIISITGFYYIYQSFKKSSEERLFDDTRQFLEKSEKEIDNILEIGVFVQLSDEGKVAKNSIYELLRIRKDLKITGKYLDYEMKYKYNLVKEIRDIRFYLIFIMDQIEKMDKVRAIESEVLRKYYRRKYYSIVDYLFNTKIYSFANEIEIMDKEIVIQKEIDDHVRIKEFYKLSEYT